MSNESRSSTAALVSIETLVIGGIPLVTFDAMERKMIRQNYQCLACRRLLIEPVKMDVMPQPMTLTPNNYFCQVY